ncbi:hypothetical protein BjapCC829_18800 [Bradyrhizobium barranii]|uniref:Membrane protein YccC n=1 Tax=Bradyrhizobium barranii TaxID=2992140 RepID=A0ABY3QWT2_9BRAD|nr:hypothetical protein [Bradyrhizobium japonicum]UFW90468.1 hypothetical protein BjapCC829_18800 [Bradyrhizobium japonicum]
MKNVRDLCLDGKIAVEQWFRTARHVSDLYRRKLVKGARRTTRREKRRLKVLERRSLQEYGKKSLHLALRSKPIRAKAQRILLSWSATLLSLLVVFAFLLFATQTNNWKASEVNLAAAQIIGAALALVLSLSIIPAQRAAELFSMAILRLYAKDNTLLAAFVILVGTTMISLLLGSNWLAFDSYARVSVAIQFLLIGISFDALRWFYTRTLDLLIPQSAIELVVRECNAQISQANDNADRLIRLDDAAGASLQSRSWIRATIITRSGVPRSLKYWTSQLEEFAHRFVARKDTSAVDGIVAALADIGGRYVEGRRDSVILHLDADNLFAGRLSDIEEVLNPIYESIQLIIIDAIGSANERIVRNAIVQQGTLARLAVSVTSKDGSGLQSAPLAFAAAYYLDRSVRAAEKASMIDAVLAGIESLQALLLTRDASIPTNEMKAQVQEALFELAVASYRQSDSHIVPYRSVSGLLRCMAHEIEGGDFSEIDFKDMLAQVAQLLPYEIRMDLGNRRQLMTFPPYSLGFEHSIPMLLQSVAAKVHVDNDRPWADPFSDFLEASEEIRHHYRSVCRMAFGDALLRKWIVESLLACVQIHLHLIKSPIEGTEPFLAPVFDSAEHLISWTSGFFPDSEPPAKFAATDAANGLAIMGMDALEEGWFDIARACASAISALANNSAGVKPEPYTLGDLHERLEILARAADVLGNATLSAEFRAMISRPMTILDTDWPHFLSARATRFRQLDEALGSAGRLYPRPDDPVERLHAIIVAKKRRGGTTRT